MFAPRCTCENSVTKQQLGQTLQVRENSSSISYRAALSSPPSRLHQRSSQGSRQVQPFPLKLCLNSVQSMLRVSWLIKLRAMHMTCFQNMQAQRRQPLTCARASTETVQSTKTQDGDEDDEDVEMQIEGLTDDYCDDFVCTSSPAVEQTLRSLAKDLVRRRWTPVLFARDVKYRVRAVANTRVCHTCSALVAQICTCRKDVMGA